jgi:hypothetical protein
MSVASHSDELLGVGRSLPAFVERAQADARCRTALGQLGYRKVKTAYARQLRAVDTDRFHGLGREELWPTMDFVRDWMRAEKKRTRARVRRTFLGAMLVTIVAGLAFAAAFTAFSVIN